VLTTASVTTCHKRDNQGASPESTRQSFLRNLPLPSE
jgi:hypothetical protein